NIPHDSAHKHVSGQSVYIDDMQVNSQLLIGRVVYSKCAHGKIKTLDLDAAKKLAGVHAVLCYKDIPGANQMGPVVHNGLSHTNNCIRSQARFIVHYWPH